MDNLSYSSSTSPVHFGQLAVLERYSAGQFSKVSRKRRCHHLQLSEPQARRELSTLGGCHHLLSCGKAPWGGRQKARGREQRCRAEGKEGEDNRPRMSPAQRQRMKNIFGQEDEKTRAAMARKKQAEAEQAAAAEVDLPIIKKKKPPGAEGKQQAPRQEGAGFSGRSQPPPPAQQGGFFSRLGVGGGRPKGGSPKEDPPGAPPSGNRSINPFKIGLPSYIDDAARAFSEVDPRDEGEWDDWATQEDKDWDGPETPYMTRESYEQRRRQAWAAKKGEGTPRDVFLRPMVDLKGAQDRLGFNSTKVALEIEDEFDENRWESQEALKYAGFLIGVPLLVGFTVSRLLADPFYELVMAINPDSFALSDKSKVEGAQEVHIHEMRLRMDAATGRAPPISEEELQRELRKEAKHIAKEFRERNRRAMLNVLSDGTTATVGFGILSRKTEGRDHLFRSLSRFTSGLSDTAKAFLIIAGTDILLGYHSEEGWTAALRLLGNHWGMEPEDAPIYIFVAIVPVTMDAIFKYWIFKGLNRQNPAAAATLRSMDRH